MPLAPLPTTLGPTIEPSFSREDDTGMNCLLGRARASSDGCLFESSRAVEEEQAAPGGAPGRSTFVQGTWWPGFWKEDAQHYTAQVSQWTPVTSVFQEPGLRFVRLFGTMTYE